MDPVARRPSTSHESHSRLAFSIGTTQMRNSPVSSTTTAVWMYCACLMPEAKLQSPLISRPPSTCLAVPGRVPWPAMIGQRSTSVKISSIALSPR